MGDDVENPQAFPREGRFRELPNSCGTLETIVMPQDGMTLRDYFAGQALISVLPLVGSFDGYTTAKAIKDAWKAADLMLAARATE